jgi:hypothetical protein
MSPLSCCIGISIRNTPKRCSYLRAGIAAIRGLAAFQFIRHSAPVLGLSIVVLSDAFQLRSTRNELRLRMTRKRPHQKVPTYPTSRLVSSRLALVFERWSARNERASVRQAIANPSHSRAHSRLTAVLPFGALMRRLFLGFGGCDVPRFRSVPT